MLGLLALLDVLWTDTGERVEEKKERRGGVGGREGWKDLRKPAPKRERRIVFAAIAEAATDRYASTR